MLRNKSGQVGETMTWVVATIVIVVILILSVYAALILAQKKHLEVRGLEVKEEEGIYAGVGYIKINEGGKVLDTKTSLAHELAAQELAGNENKAAIDKWLEEANE